MASPLGVSKNLCMSSMCCNPSDRDPWEENIPHLDLLSVSSMRLPETPAGNQETQNPRAI